MAKINKEKFKKAAAGAYGNLTAIAKRLKVSRTAVYNFLERCEDMRELIDEAREEFDDIAESMIQKKIIEGDTRMIEFYATTKMKSRGYSRNLDLNVTKMPEVKIVLSDGD